MSELRNSLADLAERIREEGEIISAAERTSVEHALRAGFLLCQAKDDCQHGEWLPFLSRATISERKAQRWMQLARAGLNPSTVSDLGGVKAALDYIANLQLPDNGEVLFVSREGDDREDRGSLRCAWIVSAEDYPGCFHITAITAEEAFQTKRPPRGETVRAADGFCNGVWICLDMMIDIPPIDREFSIMPAEMMERDSFDFFGDINRPVDLSNGIPPTLDMPPSFEHAYRTLHACIDDYSLKKAKACWRAVSALEAKMQRWPTGPQMMPIYHRMANEGEIDALVQRVKALVRAHNPELFEAAAA